MKKVIFVFALVMSLASLAQAQFRGGIKGGVTTYNMKVGDFIVTNNNAAEDFGLAVKNAKFGYQFGLWARIGKGLHIQPEVLFSTNRVEYEVKDGSDIFIKEETYNNIEVPILVGLKFGPIHFQGGPVAKVFLGSDEQLAGSIENFKTDHDRVKIGYQAGIGLDLWKVQLDVRYEGSLRHFGKSITIADQTIGLDNKAGRVVASIGIAF